MLMRVSAVETLLAFAAVYIPRREVDAQRSVAGGFPHDGKFVVYRTETTEQTRGGEFITDGLCIT